MVLNATPEAALASVCRQQGVAEAGLGLRTWQGFDDLALGVEDEGRRKTRQAEPIANLAGGIANDRIGQAVLVG